MSKWIEIELIREGKVPTLGVRCPRCLHVPLWLGSPILPTNSGNLDYCPHCGMDMKGADNDDLIKRSDAINKIYKLKLTVTKHNDLNYHDGLFDAIEVIQDLPSANRTQGEWRLVTPKEYSFEGYRCSECNELVYGKTNFCPNCGCRMKGTDYVE